MGGIRTIIARIIGDSQGAMGTLLSGYLADLWGITFVFRLSAVLALVAAGLALVLREMARKMESRRRDMGEVDSSGSRVVRKSGSRVVR